MTNGEVEGIAAFLKITPEDFIFRFCEEKHGRYAIKTGKDGFCLFYGKEMGCLIHPVKPQPCALWPYYRAIVEDEQNWELTKDACPGINALCPFEEFLRQAKQ